MNFFKKNTKETNSEKYEAFLEIITNMPKMSSYVLLDCLVLREKVHIFPYHHLKKTGLFANRATAYESINSFLEKTKNNDLCSECLLKPITFVPFNEFDINIAFGLRDIIELKAELNRQKNLAVKLFSKETNIYTAKELAEVFSTWLLLKNSLTIINSNLDGQSTFSKALQLCSQEEQDYFEEILNKADEFIHQAELVLTNATSKSALYSEITNGSIKNNNNMCLLYGTICYDIVLQDAFNISQGSYHSKITNDKLNGIMLQKYYSLLEQLTFKKDYSRYINNYFSVLLPLEKAQELIALQDWLKEKNTEKYDLQAPLNLRVMPLKSNITPEILDIAYVLWENNDFSIESYEKALEAAQRLAS